MEIKWKSCLKIIGSIVLVYVVIHYWGNIEGFIKLGISAVLPLIIGGIMAYAVNILMTFYEEHYFTKTQNNALKKSKRPVYFCNLSAGRKREIRLSDRYSYEALYERKSL